MPSPTLLRERTAVYGLFLLSGLSIGAWTARIPAIKADLRLTEGELSLALLGIAAGAIAGMQFVGRLVDRYGSRRTLIPVAIVLALVLVPPAYAPTLPALALALFLFGMANGVYDVAVNANAVVVERAYRRPIMSSFHAVFSLGGFAGAAIGGLFAEAGASPRVTFVTVSAGLLVLAVLCVRWLIRDDPEEGRDSGSDRTATGGRGRRRLGGGVILLGVLGFCCLLGEGAAADWSSVYLRDTLGSSPGFAAAGYAAFSITMTAGRFAGDRLAARFGPVALVRGCGLLAGGGLALGILVGTPVAGVIGFGLFGAGLSCTVPQIFSVAGHSDPGRSGRSLAVVASLSYIGFLAGPVIIGGIAELTALSTALLVPAVLALFVAVTARALRATRPAGELPDAAPSRTA